MNSMTGYGKGVSSGEGTTITIEIKTVNHRYLDFGIKLPKTFMFLEDSIKKAVGKVLTRGHIDLYLTYEKTAISNGVYTVDMELAKSYISMAQKLQLETGLQNDLSVTSLLKVSDITSRVASQENEELLSKLTLCALACALDGLTSMREKEGISQYNDINLKLNTIQSALKTITSFAPIVVEDYRAKLNARIAEYIGATQVDESRLTTEIALYADRCSIDEEITRLTAHIVNMRQLLDSTEPVGRKLDFLVQEQNREANTIGSKANDLRITTEVLTIKNEIEKIREQAQNIE